MWSSKEIIGLLGKEDDFILFDVGAADFKDSISLRNNFPNSKIYCFEPDETNLTTSDKISESYNLNIHPFGISDQDGTFQFYSSERLNDTIWKFSGSFIKPKVKEGTSEGYYHNGLIFNMEGKEIRTYRIDTFCNENGIDKIDFMHLDVQGAETKVIMGLGEIRPSIIFAETCEYDTYETNTNLQEFDKLMEDHGYQIKERFQYDTLYVHNSLRK